MACDLPIDVLALKSLASPAQLQTQLGSSALDRVLEMSKASPPWERAFWNKPMGNPGIGDMAKSGSSISLRSAGRCWCLLGMWGWSLLEWTATGHHPRQSRAPSSLWEPNSWGKRGWRQKGRHGEGFGRLIKKSNADPLYSRLCIRDILPQALWT